MDGVSINLDGECFCPICENNRKKWESLKAALKASFVKKPQEVCSVCSYPIYKIENHPGHRGGSNASI